MVFDKEGDQGECLWHWSRDNAVRDFLGAVGGFDWNEWGCVGNEAGQRQVAPISPLPKNTRSGVV